MWCPQAINQPLPADWQEKHVQMLFQRDILEARRKQLKLQPFWSITRSSSWLIKRPRRRGNLAAISALVGNFAKPSAVLTRTVTELVTKRAEKAIATSAWRCYSIFWLLQRQAARCAAVWRCAMHSLLYYRKPNGLGFFWKPIWVPFLQCYPVFKWTHGSRCIA